MNVLTEPVLDRQEGSDTYADEITRSGDWRVILCRERWQWILQARSGAGGPARARWKARHYCRTREAAARLWQASTGEDGATLLALLPERMTWGRRGA